MLRAICLLLALLCLPGWAEEVALSGLKQPVEILRDRWGVPHIYAQTVADLFFAQGYMAARDRLFQIDLWRRAGAGHLAEVLGETAIERDRLARAVRFRGDWDAEWQSYAPDTRLIVTAFVNGINACIRALGGRRPEEFRIAGYDPGLWKPEDCVARVAGLLMVRNVRTEVSRARDILEFGLAQVRAHAPPDPAIPLEVPRGLDLKDITGDILRVYQQAISPVRFSEEGSNNWVVDGTLTATGKPLLANDPHRPVTIPSLRKTVHLVGPGWNAFGAGEPALPGIALGHNERVAFGFTIVGIDQADLYVEKLNPANPDEYMYRGQWRRMEIERDTLRVKGRAEPHPITLKYTVHGPVIHEDRARLRAYALRWVGAEPGGAGYLAGLSLARARNWKDFLAAIERYKVPSENLVYADVDGNIGWQASGLAPIRPNWSGLLPVPGDTGEYEWSGFRKAGELPRLFNPPARYIATANHNILPPGYKVPLSYEWAQPFRYQRIREMLAEKRKFTVADFERMQQDVTSLPARRFQAVLRRWKPPAQAAGVVEELLRWDARLTPDSRPALLCAVWMSKLPEAVFGPRWGTRTSLGLLLKTLAAKPHAEALGKSLEAALAEIEKRLGRDRSAWTWGALHRIHFRHPLNVPAFHRGPLPRPGDGNTVNSTSGTGFVQTNGASYRQIIDLSDWDRSVMTNVPGESGDPSSPHYDNLIKEWAAGRYHPMLFSRKAVEAATVERLTLRPAAANGAAQVSWRSHAK
ncbi:MAG: penicillin acylase family protein [Acidobacteria bacterium]|nr:penicillin acylase family protein [Acidobacteriota bacterium]